ncbi:MAG: cytochrome P450, partial [Micromonosporaceae bacterium]
MSTVDAVSFPLPVTPDGQPNPMLLELTRDTPVLKVRGPGGGDAWLISSQSVVHEVLADPARFTSMIDPDETSSRAVMVVTDPPQHTRLRRLAAQAFTARRVQALVPGIEQRVATLLDA